MSKGERSLDKQKWDTLRFGQVCTDTESFVNWKSAIEKFCSATGACTQEVKQFVNDFSAKIDKAKPVIPKKGKK